MSQVVCAGNGLRQFLLSVAWNLELQELLSAEKSAADPLNASAQAPIRRFCSHGILHMDLEATEKGTGFCWIFVFYSLK